MASSCLVHVSTSLVSIRFAKRVLGLLFEKEFRSPLDFFCNILLLLPIISFFETNNVELKDMSRTNCIYTVSQNILLSLISQSMRHLITK